MAFPAIHKFPGFIFFDGINHRIRQYLVFRIERSKSFGVVIECTQTGSFCPEPDVLPAVFENGDDTVTGYRSFGRGYSCNVSSSYPGNDSEKAGIISRNPQIVSAVFQDVVDVEVVPTSVMSENPVDEL